MKKKENWKITKNLKDAYFYAYFKNILKMHILKILNV